MAEQQVLNNRGHDSDDDNGEPRRKVQRLDNTNAPNAPEPKSITNICYDVLERIFEYLDFASFLNVADTCKRLQIAAIAKFHDDHCNTQITLTDAPLNRITYSRDDSEIRVCGLKYCLPFLRIFGGKCLSLSISSSLYGHLEQYITKYCANTLASIDFNSEHALKIHNFTKPFKNVQDVYIGFSDLGQSLSLVRNLFPNVYQMEWYGISFDENFSAVSFPELKDLAINGYQNFTMNGLSNLLHANRQLNSLRVLFPVRFESITLRTITNMIAENPLITNVWISSRPEINVSTNELWQFANERPSMIELNLPRYTIEVDDVVLFIRQMHSLKQFWFKLKDHNECDRLVNQLNNEWKHTIYVDETQPLVMLQR